MRKKDIIKMIMQHAVLPAVYRIACMTNRVDKKLAVLADAHNRSCPVYMRTLAAELKKRGYKVRGFFYDDDTNSLTLLRRMCSFMKVYAQAGTVVICDNFLPAASCRKRRGTKVVQLWHGCGAYKKFGYDTGDDIPDYYKGNVYRNYDLVTVSSEHCVKYFESAMRAKPGVVRAVGVPATDMLLDSAFTERARRRFFEAYPEAVGKKVVVWAPTFRGRADGSVDESGSGDADRSVDESCGGDADGSVDESGSGDAHRYDDANELPGVEYVDRLSRFNDVYLIRHDHPHSLNTAKSCGDSGCDGKTCVCSGCEVEKHADSGSVAENSCRTISVPDIYTLIAAADLLITDYSSACYDSVLAGKPVIFFMPDYEEYRDKRGFYMGLDELPGPVVTDEERIVTEAAKALATGRCEGCLPREAFLERYMSSCDGRSTERVADIIDEWHGK